MRTQVAMAVRPEEHLGPVGQAAWSNRPAVSPEHALRWEKQCFLDLCVVAEDSGVIARDGPQDSIGQLVECVCIPRQEVAMSPTHERVLLFLAIALMESYSVTTWLTDELDLQQTEGEQHLPVGGEVAAERLG
ncbi:hypothetical protein JBE27_11675 [Streptomyces albiflaviniger]|nr:hypothetical protein [Streptomyces albiflaviniger]